MTPAVGLSKLNSVRHAGPSRERNRRARPGSVDMLGGRRALRPGGPLHKELPRKEVIQPHLPVRLPCYDFTPITGPTFDGSLP